MTLKSGANDNVCIFPKDRFGDGMALRRTVGRRPSHPDDGEREQMPFLRSSCPYAILCKTRRLPVTKRTDALELLRV